MAEEKKFNHIKVKPAVDEEVIYAGGNGRSQEDDPASSGASPVVQEQPSSQEAVLQEVAKPKASQSQDAYQPTTLKDLEESKMPKTQIVVILLAVAAIAAFVIWYILCA